ncbi:MAG: hypothetical protein AAGA25_12385 [Planctomycetota bacterium]
MKLLRTSTQVLAAVGSMAGVWWAVADEAPAGLSGSASSAESSPASQAGAAAETTAADGPAYAITAFDFVVLRDLSGLPTEAELNDIVVELLETPTGYVAPRPGSTITAVRLGDLHSLPQNMLYASAANHVAAAVVRDFNDRGIIGVLVSPDPNEIRVDFTDQGTAVWGTDLRADGNTTLRLLVRTNIVSEMRTVASGDRITDGQRVNHPSHRRILSNSPVGVGDLVNRREIDDYLFDLNRHPGRNAAVAVSTGLNPAQGDTVLDYLVSEAKPWTAFFNLSNTGTRDTREWRERFGYLNTQFTGNDDILSMEYVTAGFEESQAVFISYERPFESNDRVHWRTYGTFQDFTASDVGAPGADFDGTEYGIGGELIWNFWQKGPSFLDLVGGARWESVHVDNQFAVIEETEPFFIPYLGVAYENTTQVNATTAYLGVEFNLDGLAGTDSPDIDGLGRLNTDADWVKFPFSLTHSFYLEPIFNRDDWLNISTPGSTLAHELLFAFRGQYVPNDRLNPQAQEVLGGLYTVRGYDEAITAGDTVLIATAEYRLHIPRLFTPTPGQQRPVTQMFGEPFRTFPQEPYGSADWDLVAKAFIDAGRSVNNDRLFFEQNETLIGAGVGLDLLFKRNANFRIDYGVALEDAAGTTSGSSQFHFSFTLLY